jgi:hypothetical protein
MDFVVVFWLLSDPLFELGPLEFVHLLLNLGHEVVNGVLCAVVD